jgi:AraC family transcriptional activator of pobA
MCTSCMMSAPGQRLATMLRAVSEGASPVRTVAMNDRETFQWLLVSMHGELEADAAWKALAIEGYLSLLAAIVLRADRALDVMNGAEPHATLSGRALAFITEKATDGISLADVARHVHRSAAHTATVVKAETGRTVVEWITHARLAAARQLLLKSDESVESIGSRMGFASPSHFHRVFKRHHGATPSEWRKAHFSAPAVRGVQHDE